MLGSISASEIQGKSGVGMPGMWFREARVGGTV